MAVGDLFEVSGAGSEEEALVLGGDLRGFDGIGAGMTSGEIEVRGDVGAWAGAEMAGGVLRILGDAGARLGAAYPGARAGMTGGEIVVSGDAGEEAGAGMRRGLVAVGGRTASRRRAADAGGHGDRARRHRRRRPGSATSAAASSRGGRWSRCRAYAFATRFQSARRCGLQLLRVRELGLTVDDALLRGAWARWSGDRTELGRGEILIFDDEEEGQVSLSMNERAATLVDAMAPTPTRWGSRSGRSTPARASWTAARRPAADCRPASGFAAACMGGLGRIDPVPVIVGDRTWPGVGVTVDAPAAACLAAQYAGWKLEDGDFFAMASGPGRALARAEDLFEELAWREQADRAVLCLETRQDPPARDRRQGSRSAAASRRPRSRS